MCVIHIRVRGNGMATPIGDMRAANFYQRMRARTNACAHVACNAQIQIESTSDDKELVDWNCGDFFLDPSTP
eukprot:SAG11_NODE_115_length_16019_cov_12.462940_2_plen_72_part_00